MIRATRNILLSHHSDWNAHFTPRRGGNAPDSPETLGALARREFTAPPAPASVDPSIWPLIAEHVARAELVSEVVRTGGLESAVSVFGKSNHAIELATVIAAAVQADEVTLELCEALLACPIDELVMYGTFLQILIDVGGRDRRDRVLAAYESFCSAATTLQSSQAVWPDRVAGVQDGLATLYVLSGRHDDAERLFDERHEAQAEDLVVALTASRSFLSVGAVGRAVHWLDRGEQRARELGRTDMADTLARKQVTLKKRLS